MVTWLPAVYCFLPRVYGKQEDDGDDGGGSGGNDGDSNFRPCASLNMLR